MNSDLLQRVHQLKVWKRGAERAPHKPLLLLYALGRLQRGAARLVSYDEVDRALRPLLEEFGPPRKSYHPEFPFFHLTSDGLWQLKEAGSLALRGKGKSIRKSELLEHGVQGGFPPAVHEILRNDPEQLRNMARQILEEHFPESYYPALLEAVGLDLHQAESRKQRQRSADFRARVLNAYDNTCVFCGFSAWLDNATVGMEAAHILWFQMGGPDDLANGLACCALHHLAFDRGAIGIDEQHRIMVSNRLHGQVEHAFLNVQGRPLRSPNLAGAKPDAEFLAWHRKEVFRQPARSS